MCSCGCSLNMVIMFDPSEKIICVNLNRNLWKELPPSRFCSRATRKQLQLNFGRSSCVGQWVWWKGSLTNSANNTGTGRWWMIQEPWWFCVWFQGFQKSLRRRRPREDTDDNPQSYRWRRLDSWQGKNDSHLQFDAQRVEFLNVFLNCSTHGRNEDHFIWMRGSCETPRGFPVFTCWLCACVFFNKLFSFSTVCMKF